MIFAHTADLHLGVSMRGLSSCPDAPPSGSARRHAMPLSSGHIPARMFDLRTHTTWNLNVRIATVTLYAQRVVDSLLPA